MRVGDGCEGGRRHARARAVRATYFRMAVGAPILGIHERALLSRLFGQRGLLRTSRQRPLPFCFFVRLHAAQLQCSNFGTPFVVDAKFLVFLWPIRLWKAMNKATISAIPGFDRESH